MARKYVSDYRLDNVLGADGKLKTVPVYTGEWYEFEASEEEIQKTRLRYLLLLVGAVLSLLWLLVFTNHMDRGWYLSMPAALSTIFLLFAGMSVYRLWTAKGPVTREHKDKTHDRMATSTLFVMILSCLCLIGCIYHLIWVKAGFQQFVFTFFAAVYAACSIGMFAGRKALRMKLSDKPRYEIKES